MQVGTFQSTGITTVLKADMTMVGDTDLKQLQPAVCAASLLLQRTT
jgi:hypothetical protein